MSIWRNRNTCTLLVGIYNGVVTVENSIALSQKIKNRTTIRSSNPTLGLYPKNLNQDCKMIPALPVHCNTIHSGQDVETTQMSIDR